MHIDSFSGSVMNLRKSDRNKENVLRCLLDDQKVSTWDLSEHRWISDLIDQLTREGLIKPLPLPFPWCGYAVTEKGQSFLKDTGGPQGGVMTETMRIHINRPQTRHFVALNHCPTCERDRRMLGSFAEWYGTTWTCAGCGDQWSEGERHDRPFYRYWRRDNIRRARKTIESIGLKA